MYITLNCAPQERERAPENGPIPSNTVIGTPLMASEEVRAGSPTPHLQQNAVPTPKVHGLFQDRDPGRATAILMDHAGTRIDQVPGGLSEAQHDAGGPVIVDFGNAIVVHRKKRKTFKGEMEQLRRVLGQSASEIGPHS
ncbi:hypothetical protein M405DRAFT_844035 [Rhizopogon salebrosus TDB-379]|nr:hypothetical protein M405DRAFT_844035 [Rhizopogon salebrosus TDB-379]